MPNEDRNGSYDEFNKYEASWMCPHCHRDTLRLDEHFRYHGILHKSYTFFCTFCGFDSEYFGIKVKNNDSFNAAHKKMLRDWKWMQFLIKKGYNEGVKDGFKMAEDKKKLDELYAEFEELLECFKMGF